MPRESKPTDLPTLAHRINEQHQLGETTTLKGLEHFRAAGNALIEARHKLGKRKFAPWLKEHVKFSRQTAYNHIRLAENWQAICPTVLQMETGLRAALRFIGTDQPTEDDEGEQQEPQSATSTAATDGTTTTKEKGKNTKKPKGDGAVRSDGKLPMDLYLAPELIYEWDETVAYLREKVFPGVDPSEVVFKAVTAFAEEVRNGKNHSAAAVAA